MQSEVFAAGQRVLVDVLEGYSVRVVSQTKGFGGSRGDDVVTWERVPGTHQEANGADVDRVIGSRATEVTKQFRCGDDARITFGEAAVSWVVLEGENAVAIAHDHPVAQALFGAIKAVRWTKGTGGELYRGDESGDRGPSARFGPIAATVPSVTRV